MENKNSIYCFDCSELILKKRRYGDFYYCKIDNEMLRTVPMTDDFSGKFPVKSLLCIERLSEVDNQKT